MVGRSVEFESVLRILLRIVTHLHSNIAREQILCCSSAVGDAGCHVGGLQSVAGSQNEHLLGWPKVTCASTKGGRSSRSGKESV